MHITNDIKYIGVNDHEIDLFEGQYVVPNGMAYNSYAIIDEKIAIMDSVDARFSGEWIANVKAALDGRSPDYLVIQHMEPDHSSSLTAFMDEFPSATIVSSDKAFVMMKQFFGSDYPERKLVVADGGSLCLGNHTLNFVAAPMVHWPEVMVTYDSLDKVLFSADAFGKFGALDADEDWACEARRYYFGIVGKYGVQAKKLLAQASALDINIICPLHGPVLSENLGYYLDLYNTWAGYGVESDGIVIAYTSVYGNTKKAVEMLEDELLKRGCTKVAVNDLARCDMAEAVEDAFRYGKIVLATTTYNGDIFPFMREFVHELCERGYQNRTIGLIENGTWAPTAARKIKTMFEKSKNITFTENSVKILSSLNEASKAQVIALADELCKN
jgi:flavorubredoxin